MNEFAFESRNARTVADVNTIFNVVDRDRDGYLTGKELASAIQDERLARNATPVITTLYANFDELAGNRGINRDKAIMSGAFREDDRKLASLQEIRERKRMQQLIGDWSEIKRWDLTKHRMLLEAIVHRAREQARDSTGKLFADTKNPLDSIRPEAIEQGMIGDCYFLAAMSSLAASPHWKQKILDMIKTNRDGTYTVTFPGAPEEPITIKAPTDAEMTLFARDRGYGTWPAVLEKAYGVYCKRDFSRRGLTPNEMQGFLDSEGADGGSIFNAGLKILTGRDVNRAYTAFNSEESLHKILSTAFEDDNPVVATTFGNIFDHTGYTDDGLLRFHEFGVLGYDPQTKTITIRNPWGHTGWYGDRGKDGVFKMNLSKFRSAFGKIAIAEKSS